MLRSSVQKWFDDNLQAQPLSPGGVRPAASPNTALAQALANISPRAPPFAAAQLPAMAQPPPLRSRPTPIAPSPGLREPSPQQVPFQGIGGGGRDLGGGAVAAGLGKLGTGIEAAMKTLAARQQAKQADLDAANAARLRQPAPFGTSPAAPAVRTPTPFLTPPGAPYTPPPVGPAGATPAFTQPGAQEQRGPVPPIGAAGTALPTFAQGVPGAAIAAQGGNLQKQIAQHIVNYAASKGVPPQTALGIAWFEGLNRSNPLATNPDGTIGGVPNTAIGPFQLGTAGLGKQLGVTADTPWQMQVEKSIDYMAAHGYGPWNSVGDRAGTHGDNSNTGPISARGADIMRQLGVSPGAAITQGGGGITSPSAAAYAAAPPSLAEPTPPRLAGPAPIQDTTPSEPRLISPGRPQTGPAYSAETWANRPRYDYGAPATGATSIPPPTPPPGAGNIAPGSTNSGDYGMPPQPPLLNGGQPGVYAMPGQQSMNDQSVNPLAAALAGQGDPTAPPQMSPAVVAALNGDTPFGFGGGYPPPAPDFVPAPDFGGFNLGGLFG